MFSPVSGSHFHPQPVHAPPEQHRTVPPAPSINVSIHVSTPAARPANVQTALHLPADYISKPRGKLYPDLIHPGLQVDEKGRRFISDGANTYAVRFDGDHGTERVYQPDSPCKPGIPVRLNRSGEYERHDVVGLKGGAPGGDLRRRFDRENRARMALSFKEHDVKNELALIDAEILRSGTPDADLLERRDRVATTLEYVRTGMENSNQRLEGIKEQASQIRAEIRPELDDKNRHREDGLLLERSIQFDINHLRATMNESDRPTSDQQNQLAKLQSDLQRVQAASTLLDQRIASMNRELRAIAII